MLCMTLLVRNEESILEENIEYHLSRGVDMIIATDNLSEDGTADILRHYEKLGVLHYLFEDGDDYSQDLWVSRMAQIASRQYHADWVIHTDADEFWWPLQGDLNAVFDKYAPEVDGLFVKRNNFLTPRGYDPLRSPLRQMTVRYTRSQNMMGYDLPPKVCHRGFEHVSLQQGNHRFELPGKTANTRLTSELIIFHYPVRDFDTFRNTVRLGGAAYSRNKRLSAEVGSTWRRLYKMHQASELEDYYQQQTYGEPDLMSLIENGEAVHDARLRDYIAGVIRCGEKFGLDRGRGNR